MFVGNVGQLKKLITQETQVFIFAVFGIFVLLLYLSHFPVISDFIITIVSALPFVITFAYIVFFYIKSKHDPEIFHMLEKYYLVSLLEILSSILVLFIIFFPSTWRPVFDFVFSVKNFVSLDNYFILASYVGLAIVCASLIFFFIRLYQKSQNQYSFPISQLFRKTLYSTFLMMLFLLGFSVLAYPQAYSPITNAVSDVIYRFMGTKTEDSQSLFAIARNALTQTKKNLVQEISQTNTNLIASVSEVKDNLTASISSSSETLTTDIDKKFDSDGGTISGDTKVKGEFQTEDVIPQSDGTYDLGSSSKGWDNIYVSHLIGSSPVTVGTGTSSHSLTDNDDLIVSGDLEVNGTLYIDGTVSGALTASGALTTSGALTASSTSTTHTIGNISILNGAITGITSLNTTVSSTELGYLDGVTSAIQTQLDGKVGTTGNQTMTGNLDISRINARNSNGLKLYDDGGNGIFVENGGNVGIGNDNPSGLLQVGSLGSLSAPGSASATADSTGSNNYYVDDGYYYDPLYYYNVCSNVIAIKVYAYKTVGETQVYSIAASSSEVIDPTCDGATKYHMDYSWSAVSGAEGYRVLIKDYSRGYNYDYYYDFDSSTTSFTEGDAGAGSLLSWTAGSTVTPNAAQGLIITSSGWVGIGTASPVSALDMGGNNIALSGGYLSGDGGSEGVFVASDGKVGIGKNTPSVALDIQGGVSATGNGIISGSLQVGISTTVSNSGIAAIGVQSTATASGSVGIGDTAHATAQRAVAIGYASTASGANSLAIGYSNTSSGDLSTATGLFSTASGNSSVAIGNTVTASGTNSFAIGQNLVAGNASNSMVIGQGTSTKITNNTASSLMIGFNSNVATFFVGPASGNGTHGNVGIGTSSPSGRLHSYVSNAAVTASSYDGYFENLATNSTTDSVNKYGAYITSTGTFTGGVGAATNNYGLYIGTTAGADNNYDIYAQSGANLTTAGAWTDSSDISKKKDIKNLSYGLSDLLKLRPVNYTWKLNDQSDIGFIAQELREIIPEVVYGIEGSMSVSYSHLTALAIKAIQEQQAQINTITVAQETIANDISNLNLKTDENITTLAGLQASIDEQFLKISKSLNEQEKTNNDQDDAIKDLESQIEDSNSQISDLEKILQDQIDELKKQTSQDLNLAQLELNTANIESNTQDIALIKQILGITDKTEGNISILGKLTAEKVVVDGIETGGITIVEIDGKNKTIGEAVICEESKKWDSDDEECKSDSSGDGKSVDVETDAITENSKVFVTPIGDEPVDWIVKVAEDKAKFSIILNELMKAGEYVKFNWWIVESK